MKQHVRQLVIAGMTNSDAHFPLLKPFAEVGIPFDPIDAGFCTLKQASGTSVDLFYQITEPMSLELLREILDKQHINSTYSSLLTQLTYIIHQDPKVKYMGNLFESAVASYMVENWHGLTIAELPFLAPYRHLLPPWCENSRINWTQFGASDRVNDRSHGELTPDIPTSSKHQYHYLLTVFIS